MEAVTLYQFELCPFCHKVKAAMDAKGIPYRKIEVNPFTKKELPELPEGTPKKVPVIQYQGETVQDSTAIMQFLDERIDGKLRLTPENSESRDRCNEIEAWVDKDLAQVLPTVIYGTWSDSTRAAQITAKNSNFGLVQNMLVRAGGSVVMHQIAKRIIAKRGGGEPEAMLEGELDRLESWIADDGFVCGDQPTLGDVAAQGVLKCIQDFPAFGVVKSRPRISAWFDRVEKVRSENRATS